VNIDLEHGFPTREEADALHQAIFPKSVGARSYPSTDMNNKLSYHVNVMAMLQSNKANQGVNEGGLKRYEAAMKAIDRAGHTARWDDLGGSSTAYRTRAEFESHMAAARAK
jgi:hypothetical protein